MKCGRLKKGIGVEIDYIKIEDEGSRSEKEAEVKKLKHAGVGV